jgi:phage pi2 protein 07
MNRSYEYWENQFLHEIAIEYGFEFKSQEYLVFKARMLLKNILLSNPELLKQLDEEQGGNNYFTNNMIADCWSRKIYPTLEAHGFQEERKAEKVRKWLQQQIFPEYIKNIQLQTKIELWQELLTKAEDAENLLQIVKQK